MEIYLVLSKPIGFLAGILDHSPVAKYVPWIKTISERKWGLKSVAHTYAFILAIVSHVQGIFLVRMVVLQLGSRQSLQVTIDDVARNPPPNMLNFI